MNEISNTEKEQILSDILNSAEFKNSKRYQDLLRYLFEKSEKNGSVKEMEIAIDIFGKGADFDPNTNPLIRSYVSNLRKKLEHYYFTTENTYNYQLTIPKGQYSVNFEYVDTPKAAASNNSSKQKYFFIIIAGLSLFIVILISLLIYQGSKGSALLKVDNTNVPNPIWREFVMSNSYPTLVVLGDYYFLNKINPGGDRILMRNTKINNEKDFQNFLKTDPNEYSKYTSSNFTYLRPSAPYGILEIIRALGNNGKNVTIKLASQLKWEDFDKHNVVFLGTFKTLYKLDTLLAKTNIRYSVEPSRLRVINKQKEVIDSFAVKWVASNYQNDYSTIIKIPGSKSNSILFFLGFSEIGVIEAVKSGIDKNFIQRVQIFLKKDVPDQPMFFEMISQSEGIELTTFQSKIEYFNFLQAR